MKDSKVNYTTRPIPSTPGAQQITNDGLMSKKGSAPFVSDMPKQHVVPASKKSSDK
jgi:hypothetical protein